MRLWALSDLHVNHRGNLDALAELPSYGDDWVIAAGDIGDSTKDLGDALDVLCDRFAQVLWVPGNHDLWASQGPRGEARYRELVDLCRARGVITPEDPYVRWPGSDEPLYLCPLFLLYDYSFSPDGLTPAEAITWASEDGIRCVDELLLHPSRADWCRARVQLTAARLEALPPDARTVLINHWPLRYDLVRLYRIPRFSPWCGTRATEDWHTRFRADVVVSGHLHMRATDWRDGVRFEEVSLGYPRHWRPELGAAGYLREILPGPASPPEGGQGGPVWHR